MDTDVFERLTSSLIDTVGSLPPHAVSFMVHAVWFVFLPTAVCFVVRTLGLRSQGLQLLCFAISMAIAGTVPMPKFELDDPVVRTWALGLCVLLTAILPTLAARQMAQQPDARARLTALIYATIACLALANFGAFERWHALR